VAKDKDIKCYFCGKMVETVNVLVEKKIPMATKAGIRNYRRQFHIDCLPKYLEDKEDKSLLSEENKEWDAVYQYFRKEILGLDESKPLDQHTIKRLLGLRLGQYYPSGNNTRILQRGYEFSTILITLKVIKSKVIPYMATANFANGKHKTDSIMRFITGEINDVYKRLENQKKSNDKLEKDVVVETFDYKSKLKEQKKKEANGIEGDMSDLFGGLL
jgi:hypothetical protein